MRAAGGVRAGGPGAARHRRPGLALGVALALLAWLLPGALRAAGDPFAALALIRHDPPAAPRDFGVLAPGGHTLKLGDYRGKVVLLNFWATWCPPCREEMPAMQRLYERYRARGFVVLALSIDTDGEISVAPYVAARGFTFPVGLDSDLGVADRYRVRVLPSSFVVDRRGRVVASAFGARDWDGADSFALVESLLAGR